MGDETLAQGFWQPLTMVSVFLALMIAEAFLPLRKQRHPWVKRVPVNLVMSGIAAAVGTFVTRAVALAVSLWCAGHSFGLLQWIAIPPAVEFVAGFLLMDLTFYYWHLANHAVPLMWRFHNVHHLDLDMDVSTAFRFHFGEILYSTAFRVAQVGLLGISPATYLAYELVFGLCTMFHHSNLRIHIGLERLLNRVIVTPRMHGIHHSIVREETNSNFSVVFRWWDFFHRTLRLAVPQSAVDVGVAAYRELGDNGLLFLNALPFCKQRDYWRLPDGRRPERVRPEAESPTNLLEA